MLLWPLYFTSFLIDDFLDDESMFGTQTAVLSSASSRTSSALAYLLSRRDGIEVVGLTSPGNVEFTESLGVYDRVVPYEEIDLDRSEPGRLRRHVGRRQGAQLGPRPLRRRAQAQLGRRHHPPRGPRRRLGPRWPEAGLLLRPGPAPQAHGGLGSRRPQRAHRRGLEPLRRVDPAAGCGSSTARERTTSSVFIASCLMVNPTQQSDTYFRRSENLHPGLFSRRRPRGLRLGIGRHADSYRSHAGCDHWPSRDHQRRRDHHQPIPPRLGLLLTRTPRSGTLRLGPCLALHRIERGRELPLRVLRRRSGRLRGARQRAAALRPDGA